MTIQQNTEEWLDLRKTMIGASDAPIIMGMSPYKTALQLWREKLDLDEGYQTEYMRRGLMLEDAARVRLKEDRGIDVKPKVVMHSVNNWQMASLDGISDDGKTIVEIKCSGKKYHQEALNGTIPEHYKAQLQHQMECTGLDEVYYYSFDGQDGVLLKMERDQEFIDQMIKMEEKFYECMISMVPPEITCDDYVLNESEEWKELEYQWEILKIKEKLVNHEKKLLKEGFLKLSNGRLMKGAGVTVYKSVVSGKIDYDKIEVLKGIDLEQYRGESKETWGVR